MPNPPQTPRPLDLQTDRRRDGETRGAARCQGSRGKASQNKALAAEEFLLIPQTKEARLRWGSYLFPKQKEARLRGGSYLSSIEVPLSIRICCRGLLA